MVECNSRSSYFDSYLLKIRVTNILHGQVIRSHHHFGALTLQSRELLALFSKMNRSDVAIIDS